MKDLNSLVDDVYKLMSDKNTDKTVDINKEIEDFGEACKAIMKKQFLPSGFYDNRRLRLSAVGKPDRQLWFDYQGFTGEKIMPHTLIKFMYGHLVEEMILFLIKMAGHTVEDEQKQCSVEGVKGHMDARIDGVLVDVKSASTHAFKKFKEGTLKDNDPFGYYDQLTAYAHSEGDSEVAWIAFDKQNGHLCVLKDTVDGEEVAQRIRDIKKFVREEMPSQCYQPIPDGKSGNLKLATGCSYCKYKKHCYPDLRTFAYSGGVRHLVKVVNEPKVPEVGEL